MHNFEKKQYLFDCIYIYLFSNISCLNIFFSRPLPSAYGQIENDDRPHVPITVFTQSDIDSNKIIYRPPVGGLPGIQYELARRRTNQHSRYAAHSALDSSR